MWRQALWFPLLLWLSLQSHLFGPYTAVFQSLVLILNQLCSFLQSQWRSVIPFLLTSVFIPQLVLPWAPGHPSSMPTSPFHQCPQLSSHPVTQTRYPEGIPDDILTSIHRAYAVCHQVPPSCLPVLKFVHLPSALLEEVSQALIYHFSLGHSGLSLPVSLPSSPSTLPPHGLSKVCHCSGCIPGLKSADCIPAPPGWPVSWCTAMLPHPLCSLAGPRSPGASTLAGSPPWEILPRSSPGPVPARSPRLGLSSSRLPPALGWLVD